ncbi:MAG: hypothetical protein LC796_11330 [Acidobacteria bacterium]|nr:hypothetical protein [Acidobacteriota bacterium]MCA1617416.1 hypothetical protein [Acidobacteriota bacterium]
MTFSLGNRKQLGLFLIVATLLVLVVVRWRSAPAAPATSTRSGGAPAPAGAPDEDRPTARARARDVKPATADDVPIITTKDLDPQRGRPGAPGSRNIFDLRAPTPIPPPTPTPAPAPPPAPGSAAFIGPLPPPPPTPTPAPPEIGFKFIGTFGPKDRPFAVLVQGDQIINARMGEVVFDRFIVRRVGYESVDVGFVGFAPSQVRRLGIAP